MYMKALLSQIWRTSSLPQQQSWNPQLSTLKVMLGSWTADNSPQLVHASDKITHHQL